MDVADLDGDGDEDLVFRWRVPGASETRVGWMERVAPSQFNPVVAITPAGLDIVSVAPADIDADGDLDLTAIVRGTDGLAWFENDGTAVFGGPQWIEQAPDLPNFLHLDPVDFNQDGLMDVLVVGSPGGTSNSPTEVVLFAGTAGGGFGARQALASVPRLAGVVDFGDVAGVGRRTFCWATGTVDLRSWAMTARVGLQLP